jgi:hypothetical protein
MRSLFDKNAFYNPVAVSDADRSVGDLHNTEHLSR